MHRSAIVVAGGTGTRMGSAIPKQFHLLAGLPVLMHSVNIFSRTFPGIEVVIALPEDQFDYWKQLCRDFGFDTPHNLTPGGAARFHSVKNALAAVTPGHFVAIHDAARPLASPDLVRRMFAEAMIHGNAIPVIPVAESLRIVESNGNRPADRSLFRIVQTPQVFGYDQLRSAYLQDYQPGFTDDATVVEQTGVSIHLAEGEKTNIKLTLPEDMQFAQTILASASPGL